MRDHNKQNPGPERDVDSCVPFLSGRKPQEQVVKQKGGEGDTLAAPPLRHWFSSGHMWQNLQTLRVVTAGLGRGRYWHLAGRGQRCCLPSNSAQDDPSQKTVHPAPCQQRRGRCRNSAPGLPAGHVLEHLQRPLSEYRGSPTDLSYTSSPRKTPSPSLP